MATTIKLSIQTGNTPNSQGHPPMASYQNPPQKYNPTNYTSSPLQTQMNQQRRPNSLAATTKELNYHNQVQQSTQYTNKLNSSQVPINVAILLNNNITVQQQQQLPSQRQQYHQGGQMQGVNARTNESGDIPQQAKNHNQHHYQQQSHSLGRDLQGMGLITQVKKGESVPVAYPSGVPINQMHHSNLKQNDSSERFDDFFSQQALLKPQRSDVKGRKTLVLDLDETLVHSSFKPPTGREPQADIVLPVDIEGRVCNVYVVVRPGCLQFLNEMSKYYEVVIFTASLSKYADPLMDIIDQQNVAPQRLFREHCTFSEQLGVFVKDMARLGRNLKDSIIIDNSPLSFAFQPENGMPILSWYDDRTDTKLIELIPVLQLLSQVPDVRPILRACCSKDNVYQNERSIAMCTKILEDLQNTRRLEQQVKAQQQQRFSPMKSRSPLKLKTENDSPQINNWVSVRTSPEKSYPSQRESSHRNNPQGPDSLSVRQNSLGNKTQDVRMFTKMAAQTIEDSKDSTIQRHTTTLQVYETIQAAVENQSQRMMMPSSVAGQQKKQLAISKKRPQTAHRDQSKNGSPSRATKLTVVKQIDNSFKEGINVSLNNISSSLNSPITIASKKQMVVSQTPNINKIKIPGGKSESFNVQKSKKGGIPISGFRPLTSQNSTRNSQERVIGGTVNNILSGSLQAVQNQSSSSVNIKQQSKSRAASARKAQTASKTTKPQTFSEKDLLMISSPHTPSASKNLSKVPTPSTNYSPIAPQFITQSVKQQQVRSSSTKQSVAQLVVVETPPTKQVNAQNLINRLVQSTTNSPMTGKKMSAPPKSQSKRQVSRSPASNLKEDGVTGGRTPGKIFASSTISNSKTDFQRQKKMRDQALEDYSTLMKNLAPHFNSTKPLTSATSHNHSRSSSKNQLNKSSVLIKGAKLNNMMVLNQTVNFSALKQQQQQNTNLSATFTQSNILKQALLQLDQSKEIIANATNAQQILEIAQTQSSTSSKQNNIDHQLMIAAGQSANVPQQSSSLHEMSSMLNEFEQTQKFNKEKLLMRNIGSPKQPSGVTPAAAHR